MQPRFLRDEVELVPDVEPAGRHLEFGDDDLDPVDGAVDRRRRFDVLLDAFHRGPGAGEAREGVAVEAVVHQLLHPGWVENRDHGIDEVELRLMRDGRGFRGVVVAHEGEHPAVLRRAGEIGVAEHVCRAVDARPLPVPEAEDAVVLALARKLRLLRAPERGGRQFLVQSRLEDDARLLQLLLRAEELLVQPAERRSAIARYETGRVKSGAPVPLALHQQHADDGLRPSEEDLALVEVELVGQRHVTQCERLSHADLLPSPERLMASKYGSNADIC
jgi:hypothetical protein